MPDQEVQRVGRREGLQDLRMVGDARHPARADGHEPGDHHRPEHPAHGRGASALHQEQRHDDHRGDRHHEVLQRRLDDLDPLDRGQHGDRRSDHAVAEEQRGAEDAQRRQSGGVPSAALCAPAPQLRDQCHDAALAVVVGAQGQQDVGDRDDDRHRPEHEGDHAVHVVGGDRDRMRIARIEHRLDRVDRAGADVAEHHAERGDHHGRPHRVARVRSGGHRGSCRIGPGRVLVIGHGDPPRAACSAVSGARAGRYRSRRRSGTGFRRATARRGARLSRRVAPCGFRRSTSRGGGTIRAGFRHSGSPLWPPPRPP